MYIEELPEILYTTTKVNIIYDCCGKKHVLNWKDANKNFLKNNEKHICRNCWLKNDNPAKKEEVKKKIKNTNLKRYGNNCSMNSKKNIDKRIEILKIKKNEIQDKKKKTCIEKYGFNNPMKNKEIKEKFKSIFKEKYGTETPLQNEKIRKKMRNTMQEKYGVLFNSQSHISIEILNKLHNPEWLYDQHYNENKTCVQIAREVGVSKNHVSKLLNKYHIDVQKKSVSDIENEIKEYIENLGIKCLMNKRNIISPLELDIYLPDYKLAIEFNGIYWHSYDKIESYSQKNKHLYKTLLCKKQGIQLLHIFENEWVEKKDIWKSIISSKLRKNNEIHACECKVYIIEDLTVSKDFLNNNHLQGYCPSEIKIGLFYKKELVSFMSFIKFKHDKNIEWELLRFCNKKYTTITNGVSKIFRYFIKNINPNSVISYADRRYNNENLYKSLNMINIKRTNPNYYWVKLPCLKLYSKLVDNSFSEAQSMFINKYRRIWDCGSLVYKWEK